MLTLFSLLGIIIFIIISTTRFHLHPFLSLLIAAISMGFLGGLDANSVVNIIADGFGSTLKSIGIVIACGAIIGVFLEKSGGAKTLAAFVLKLVGEKRAPLAMNLTGLIVSIPVFCDSGFILLSPLNKAISKKTGISMSLLGVALATGLYTTHVFVPPTPGPLAAAAALGADIGLVILLGLLVSVPTALAGWFWANYMGKKFNIIPKESTFQTKKETPLPGTVAAFAPLLLPILLITLRSCAELPSAPLGSGILRAMFQFAGNPVIALLIGVFTAFTLKSKKIKETAFTWVGDGLTSAGVIILITGAGGAFGSILRSTDLGNTLGTALMPLHIGIFLPFVIAAVLKTAQGSSTVAIITTAALVAPLLEPMGLTSPAAKALVVLAIGAGSMTVSHANDSYFWVVSQFSDMDTATALRCHTIATLFQGIAGILVIAGLQLFIG